MSDFNFNGSPENNSDFPSSCRFGIFDKYITAYEGNSEVPMESHFACLKTTISAILGRRVFIGGTRNYFTNCYVALVGETSHTKKSTAVDECHDRLSSLDKGLIHIDNINSSQGLEKMFALPDEVEFGEVLNPDQTMTGGIADMAVDRQTIADAVYRTNETEGIRVIAEIDELSQILLRGKNAATADIPASIQGFYNFPTRPKTRVAISNPNRVKNPCLYVIGATTAEQFEDSLSLSEIHGGLANRFEYYHAKRTRTIGWDKPGEINLIQQVQDKVSRLIEIFVDSEGSFRFFPDDEAYNLYDEWYKDYCSMEDNEENPLIKKALARAHVHCKKNALLFAALKHESGDCIIDKEDMQRAIDLQEYLIRCAKSVFGNFVENTDAKLHNSLIDKIGKYQKDKGWVYLTKLLGSVRKESSAQKILTELKSLESMGSIQVDPPFTTIEDGAKKIRINPES